MEKGKRFGLAVLFLLGAFAHAQAETPMSKEEKLRRLREAMRGGTISQSEPAKGKKSARKEAAPVDLRAHALGELKPKSYSESAEPSRAIVRTHIIEAKDPVYNLGLQLGLTIQPYSARGQVPMITYGENDLSRLESTWQLGLEMRYVPWTTEWLGRHGVGVKLGGAYSRQAVSLRGPTGASLGATQIHSLNAYAMLSQEWLFTKFPEWGWGLDLGGSRFDLIQTSADPLASASDSLWLGLVRTGPTYRAGDFWFNLSYERRQPLTRGDWARVDANSFVLGALYGIR